MTLIEFNGKKPDISEKAYVSPQATLIGDVKINDNVIIWPGSIIRADKSQINIGEYSTIFDGVILYTRFAKSSIHIGRYCIIETGTTILGSFLEDYVQIMEGSILYEETSVGEGVIILNKSEVPPGFVVPARAVMKGNPVEKKREQTRNDVLEQKERAHYYSELFIKIKNHLPNAQSYLLTLPDFLKIMMKRENL
jgi:carbonic anhydrase/acetyltransferase-like protein (isoleucine patch superfamily)